MACQYRYPCPLYLQRRGQLLLIFLYPFLGPPHLFLRLPDPLLVQFLYYDFSWVSLDLCGEHVALDSKLLLVVALERLRGHDPGVL